MPIDLSYRNDFFACRSPSFGQKPRPAGGHRATMLTMGVSGQVFALGPPNFASASLLPGHSACTSSHSRRASA